MTCEVVIIGAGVSGLTCGIRLLERNFRVKIVAHQLSPDTTSDVAGAFWEPYKAYPWERVQVWSRVSLEEFRRLAEIPGTGVSVSRMIDLHKSEASAPDWAHLAGFREASEEELPDGFVRGFVMAVPKIETPIYMPYLNERFLQSGGQIQHLSEPLTHISELTAEHPLLVNCTGSGAGKFCADDNVFPIRGQIVRLEPIDFNSIALFEEEDVHTLLVPRTNDCVLGGTAEAGNWSTEPSEKAAAAILERCRRLYPALDRYRVLRHQVGIRPGRNEVRLEAESVSASCTMIHNYGHGGAGFTLSWGCADEVCELVKAATVS